MTAPPSWLGPSGHGPPGQWPPSASTQLNELLDNPKAPELVRAMPSVQLHRLVAAAGRADSLELLAMAGPEQIRELLDLELWQGDRLQVDEGLDWLQTLLALPSPIRRRTVRALDVELIGTLLLNRVRVHLIEDIDDDWAPAQAEGPLHRTPDGWFWLELLGEPGEQERLVSHSQERVRDLIEQLYADDPEGMRRLLHNLIGELPGELEEMSYRWRNGRLQDLGFADPQEAFIIYAYLDPRSVSPAEDSADRPLRSDPESPGSTDLVQILPVVDSFWHQAVGSVEDPEERKRIAMALLAVSNRAMAADQVHASDLQAAQTSLDGLHARLSLGLEYLCGGDVSRAPVVLAGVALLRIARVGHSLTLEARRKLLGSLREARLGSAPGKLDRLDPPLSLQIGALLAPRPARYIASERRARPFRNLAELGEAEGWMHRALAAAELAEDQGPPRPWPPRLTFGDLYRSAVCSRLLQREPPFDEAAVARLIREQVQTGELRRAAPRIVEAAATISALAGEWAEIWLRELEERLAPLDPDNLDLRLVSGLWLE